MGHLYQERAIIRSTKKNLPETTDPLEKETDTLEQDSGNIQTHVIYIAVEEISGKIYTYQMGISPAKLIWCNRCVVLLQDYDSNAIIARSTRNRTKEAMAENIRNCTKR